MATLSEIEDLLKKPVASEEYTEALEAALLSIVDDSSVHAQTIRQIGEEILRRAKDILANIGSIEPEDFVTTKDGKIYMTPGTSPIIVPDVSARHKNYVFDPDDNVFQYDDGKPINARDIFDQMEDD